MNKFFILLLLLSGFVGATSPLNAQVAAPFDTSRMRRDLDIMEGILDRLVFGSPGRFIRISGDGAQGIYLPKYGVIFRMPLRHAYISVFNISPEERRGQREAYQKAVEAHEKAQQAKSTRRRGASTYYYAGEAQNINETLMEFFANYADAIGQLEDSERIAVYVTAGDNVLLSFSEGWEVSTYGAATAGVREKLAVARKSDIVALRIGRLKQNDFEKRVALQEMAGEEKRSEIDIMAGIIDAALQRRSGEPFFRGTESRGIYLDDYGVIFFTNAAFGQSFSFQFFDRPGESEAAESIRRHLIELETASKRRRENWHAEYKKFKHQLGEMIADYGHTLRQLKPQDHIAISADLVNVLEEGPHHLVCSVKKQHVDAFNSRRISREQLIKQISYMEY